MKKSIKVSYPKIQKIQLANNVELRYLYDNTIPKTYFKVIITGGSVEDSAEKTGLTNLWGEAVVYSGSKKYTRERLSSYLEDHASNFGFHNDIEFAYFSLTALSNFFEEDLQVILQVLNHPRFHKEDIQLLKKQIIQSQKKRKENPMTLARLGAKQIYWGSSPRGRAVY